MLFSNINSYGQLKVNSQAPKITVSTWLTKQNKPIVLKNKFIVLEFWATWCAPCLGALPHLNELQTRFKSQKDLIFLSITDENVEKIKRILPNFQFKSTIITDISEATHRAYKVEALPSTFLIDNKGVIKWIGDPNNLTADVIDAFINHKNIPSNSIEKRLVSPPPDTLIASYKAIFNNQSMKQAFVMTHPNDQYLGKASSMKGGSFYNQYQIGISLSETLAMLLHCNKNQLALPDSLKNKNISYSYKQDKLHSTEEGEKILLDKIVAGLNLKLSTVEMLKDVFTIEITDSTKLNKAKVINKVGDVVSGSSIADNEAVLSISNSSIKALEEELNKVLDLNVNITNKHLFNGNYDITINNSSPEELKKSLRLYGLEIAKKESLIKIYKFD